MVNLNKIKVLAAEKKIGLGDLASEVGITHQALNKILRTNSTSLDTLEKISQALGVSIDSFFESGMVIVEGNNDPGAGRGNVVSVDSEAVRLLINEMAEQRKFYAALVAKRDEQIDEFIALEKARMK